MERINSENRSKVMSAMDAARMIGPDMTIGCSGFTIVGYPKAVPAAMAELGQATNLTLFTGASVGDLLDGVLVRAGLVSRRYPYQTNGSARDAINKGEVKYCDQHLSHVAAQLNAGMGPHMDFAIIECAMVTKDGLIPAATIGASEAYVYNADKVIVELNETLPMELMGLHDIVDAGARAKQKPVAVYDVIDRNGTNFIPCPPEKIAAIVVTNQESEYPTYKDTDPVSEKIAQNIVAFLKKEVELGRLPENLLPLQSGVGSVANAVLYGLVDGGFENLKMYTEVLQDSAFHLVKSGKITSASTTAISLSKEIVQEFYDNLDFYKEHIVVRPMEISNNPEVVRRLGLISMNTPIEVDIYGNVNSTHILGTKIMNGIGGSGDFTRNATLSIFATPSTAKNGNISSIVPMVSHVDHTEHDVMVVVTEQGVADLRWLAPTERAVAIIENCAHPDYKEALYEYLRQTNQTAHTPINLDLALSWHQKLRDTGSMK